MNYDTWLAQQVEDYMRECEPKPIRAEKEYEGDGEYSTNIVYNCECCDNKECEHWKEYNQ